MERQHGQDFSRPSLSYPLQRDVINENDGVAGQREMGREQGNEHRRPFSSLGAMDCSNERYWDRREVWKRP